MARAKIVTDLNNNYFGTNKITRASSQPTSGTYTAGDLVLSSSPNSSVYGWICTASGTPGSWKVLRSAVDLTSMSWGNISGKPSTFAPTLGTSSTTAFRGDYGNVAYQHSQSAHAPSNAQRNADITKAEIEAKLTGNITTHSHSAYAPVSHGNHVPGTESANNRRFLRNDNTWQTITAENIAALPIYKLDQTGGSVTYTKLCTFRDAEMGNVHGEALLSGQGNFGGTGHMVAILRVSGRANRKVQLIKLTEEDAGMDVEVGYTRSGTSTIVWLKRPVYDGGGTIIPLSSTDVVFEKTFTGQTTVPSGFTLGSNIYGYEYMKKGPKLMNNVSLYGATTGGSQYNLIGVDTNNNIYLGWNNETYINVNNTMRVYRDVHMQANTTLFAKNARISNGQYQSLHFGPTNVRLEYSKGDAVYIAGSETQGTGYHLPFRAKQFQNTDPWIKIGGHWLTIQSSAPGGSAVGDVWIQI